MPSKRCDVCGSFCKELNTKRYKRRWKCIKCELYYVVHDEEPGQYITSDRYTKLNNK